LFETGEKAKGTLDTVQKETIKGFPGAGGKEREKERHFGIRRKKRDEAKRCCVRSA